MNRLILLILLVVNMQIFSLKAYAVDPNFDKEAGVPTMIVGSLAGFPTGLIVGMFRGAAVGLKDGTIFTAGALGNKDGYAHRAGGLLVGGIATAAVGGAVGAMKSSYKGLVDGYKRPFHGEAYSLDGEYLTDYKVFE